MITELKSPSELCRIASELAPHEWPEEILWPIHKQPVSIFGYNQVAMDRTQTRTIVEALVWTGRCQSNGEACRLIQNNAVMVNRVKVKDPNHTLSATDALPNLDAIVIEAGKYNFAIIELV